MSVLLECGTPLQNCIYNGQWFSLTKSGNHNTVSFNVSMWCQGSVMRLWTLETLAFLRCLAFFLQLFGRKEI